MRFVLSATIASPAEMLLGALVAADLTVRRDVAPAAQARRKDWKAEHEQSLLQAGHGGQTGVHLLSHLLGLRTRQLQRNESRGWLHRRRGA